jgi:hypothetical protein
MRVDLSRPLPGLLMALPLIAILLSVSRVPISATQSLSRAREAAIDTTGTAAVLCAPNIGGQSGRAIAARLDDRGSDRWNSLALVGEQTWHNRPEAAIGCEVLVSCQPRSMARRFTGYESPGP